MIHIAAVITAAIAVLSAMFLSLLCSAPIL
jgi:hypothetical protein